MRNIKQKVFIAMSGGVDSSVAAALLKEQGYQVKGVFFRLWREKEYRRSISASRARAVCQKLKIPFEIWDFRKEFKRQVVDYFIKNYARGLTPNPCIQCNKLIKFGLFIKKAKQQGADYVATGHYIKKLKVKSQKLKVNSKFNYKLFRAEDENKDQSYFLWRLNQNQLKRVLFPLGEYTKEEVKKIAKKYGLEFDKSMDSQEVCFINSSTEEFLKKKIGVKSGLIIDINTGSVLGQHQGIHFYTIGQRKNIGLAGGPWYVVGFDKNKLLVTNKKDDPRLFQKELVVKNVNWIGGEPPKLPLKIKAKIRYQHQLVSAILSQIPASSADRPNPKSSTFANAAADRLIRVVFNKPQRAVTPGQSAVFYQGKELLGGGVIQKTN